MAKGLRYFLLAVISLGVLTRVYTSFFFPLSFDELIQFDVIIQNDLPSLWDYLKVHDRQMPLQYIINFPFIKLGWTSLFGLRLPSLLFSILSIIFFTDHCRLTIGKVASLWAGAFLSVSFMPLLFSFSMRPYALLLMLSTMAQFLMGRLNQEGVKRSTLFALSLSLILMALTHYYGVILALIIFFGAYNLLNKRYNLFKRFSKTHAAVALLGILFVVLVGYHLYLNPIHPHPNHHFPGLFKILYTPFILLSTCGLGILYLAWLSLAFFQKKIAFDEADILAITICKVIPLLALMISWLYHPAFEYRFFIALIPWMLWLLIKKLDELTAKRSLFYLLLLLDMSTFTFGHKTLLNLDSRLNLEKVKRELPDLERKGTLFCGNCPYYYFPSAYHYCLGGWDFSKKNLPYSKKDLDYVVIFKDNKVFCEEHIPKGWRLLKFTDLEVYERSSSSK